MPATTLSYNSSDYEQAVERLKHTLGLYILFARPTDDQKQQALTVLTKQLDFNVHQVSAPSLISDRFVETQGNLREIFDTAQGEANIIIFEKADALFEVERKMGEDDQEEEEAVGDYLFQRMEAFKGAVVLCLYEDEHVRQVSQRDSIDLVVAFQ